MGARAAARFGGRPDIGLKNFSDWPVPQPATAYRRRVYSARRVE